MTRLLMTISPRTQQCSVIVSLLEDDREYLTVSVYCMCVRVFVAFGTSTRLVAMCRNASAVVQR